MISQALASQTVSRTLGLESQLGLARAAIHKAVGQREWIRLDITSPCVSLTVTPSNPPVVDVKPASGSGLVEWTVRLRDADGSAGLSGLARLSEAPTGDLTAVRETCLTEVATLSGTEGTWSRGSDPQPTLVRLKGLDRVPHIAGGALPALLPGTVRSLEASSDFAPAAWAVLRDEQCELYAADGNLVGRLLAEPAPTLVPSPGRKGFMSGWSALECLEWELADTLAELQRVPVDQIEIDEELRSYGLDSISLVEFCGVAGERLGTSLLPDVCYSHPTLQRLAAHLMSKDSETLARRYEEQTRVPQTVPTFAENASAPEEPSPLASENHEAPHSSDNQEPVYVVGMAGRFPGAGDVLGLWSVLCGGESVVGDVSGLRPGWGDGRRRVMGALDGIDEFDARFFNISPREAELMDPRQRLLLQEMWHALEDAGLSSADLTDKRIGVYVGAEDSGYLSRLEADTPITANHSGVLASRLSYFLDLRGPVLAINTACSSGLVALHEAWLSLRAGECDVAVVAGAHVITHPGAFDAMADAGMLSGSGCCSAFGAAADGMVPGEAVAVVVLQRGGVPGRSYGSVVASGVNYDGRTNGITAPSGSAQVDLLSGVYGVGGVDPGSVSHVMAHGTGTRLGDPVEVNALGVVFGGGVPVALSSVKSCLGHAQAASGLVSLIAVLLEMRFGVLVPSLNVGELNPFVAWDELGLEVVDRCREWGDVGGVLRRAGVSSFGISGTNAHVVVEAPAPDGRVVVDREATLLVVSAKTSEALQERLEQLAQWFDDHDQPGELTAASNTLLIGRHHFACRCAITARSAEDAARLLRAAVRGDDDPQISRGTVAKGFVPRPAIAAAVEELARNHRDSGNNLQEITEALADYYCQGYHPDPRSLYPNTPVTSLPGYPFEKQEHWLPNLGTVLAELPTHLADAAPEEPAAEPDPVEPSPPGGSGWSPTLVGLTLPECTSVAIAEAIEQVSRLPIEHQHPEESFEECGFDSITLVELAGVLQERLGLELTPDVLYSHSTNRRLADHLVAEHGDHLTAWFQVPNAPAAVHIEPSPSPANLVDTSRKASGPEDMPAIVGLAGRFPGARTVEELWEVLAQGHSLIGSTPSDRQWDQDRQRWFGALDGLAEFDAPFFEISPREATSMDPRQRLLLQEIWRGLEDAAIGPQEIAERRIGVFVGAEAGDYSLVVGSNAPITSNTNSVLAARMGYFLNLTGPHIAVDTSCSSGLVAFHQACNSLRVGDCDIAVVAGVNLFATPTFIDAMNGAGMLSPSGMCRAFDLRADGMVPGEAISVVVLQRESEARRDGRRPLARVLASAVNGDGRTNGITAPSGEAQEKLIRDALDRSGIDPADIDHVVTHGTGTRLGDPVEVNALAAAYASPSREHPCLLTSTKPNLGHSQAASGLVGITALVLAMEQENVPPSLGCEQPSDYIHWDSSPLRVNQSLTPWPSAGARRCGAVSAFGFSGTNAHVILEAGPTRSQWEGEGSVSDSVGQLLLVSAKTEDELEQRLRDLGNWLELQSESPALLANLARTLGVGRHHFVHRCAIVATGVQAAKDELKKAASRGSSMHIRRGTVARDHETNPVVLELVETQAVTAADPDAPAMEQLKALRTLAEFYCQGYEIPATATGAALLHLPTYPFARTQFWAGRTDARWTTKTKKVPVETMTVSHAEREPSASIEVATEETHPIGLRPATEMAMEMHRPLPATARPTNISLRALGAEVDDETPPPHLEQNCESTQDLVNELAELLAAELFVGVEDIDPDRSFVELGLDSILAVEWVQAVNRRFGLSVSATRIYEFPTLRQFAAMVVPQLDREQPASATLPLNSGVCHPAQHEDAVELDSLIADLAELLAAELFVGVEDIDPDRSFVELGLDSILAVEWVQAVNRRFGLSVSATRIYEFPTLRQFAALVASDVQVSPRSEAALPESRRYGFPLDSNPVSPLSAASDSGLDIDDDLDSLLQAIYQGSADESAADDLIELFRKA